jgi:hypothetical protein
VIVEVLATNVGSPPTRNNLNAWITTFGLPVTALIDPAGVGTRTLTTYGIRESTFIVDLSTMLIVFKVNGSTAGVGPSGVSQAIPRMLELLGDAGTP